MPFSEDICVVVLCDGCGDGWAKGPNDYTPHFRDYDTARQHLLDFGWTTTPTSATGDGDRVGSRLVCPDCTRLEACARRGHAWGPWNHRDLRATLPDGRAGGWTGRVRACALCPDTQWDPPLRARAVVAPPRPVLALVKNDPPIAEGSPSGAAPDQGASSPVGSGGGRS
jgi:hypothetical protein